MRAISAGARGERKLFPRVFLWYNLVMNNFGEQPGPLPESEKIDWSELEKTDCQYCEDVGPCMYCARGKAEAQRILDEKKKNRK